MPSQLTGAQPEYLVKAATRRLSLAAYLCGTVHLIYVLLYEWLWKDRHSALAQYIAIAVVLISLLVALRVPFLRRRNVLVTAIGYQLVVSFGLETTHLLVSDLTKVSSQVSWTAVVIVFFPILMLARPSLILLSSLLAASSSPAAYFLAVAIGRAPEATMAALAALWLPLFICALLSYIVAKLLHEMGADLSRAKRLGSYELVKKVREGGMGEVWQARHRLLARPAAIKLIRSKSDNAAVRARFEREAQVTASLESHHTVQLYDFGIADNGSFYYVMELLKGVDLERMVNKSGPMSPARVVYMLLQVCDSLREAHEMGLIHRDIKPANLFVTRKAQVFDLIKVLDFGLVKITGTESAATGNITTTAEGKIVGTPAYLAPEVAVGEEAVDARADLYALGCVAYFMLTGQLVFSAKTPITMAISHVTKAPLPLNQHEGIDIPTDLEQLVLACLSKRPDDRPQSAQALAALLRATGLHRQWSSEEAATWWGRRLPEAFSDVAHAVPSHESETTWLQPAGRR